MFVPAQNVTSALEAAKAQLQHAEMQQEVAEVQHKQQLDDLSKEKDNLTATVKSLQTYGPGITRIHIEAVQEKTTS